MYFLTCEISIIIVQLKRPNEEQEWTFKPKNDRGQMLDERFKNWNLWYNLPDVIQSNTTVKPTDNKEMNNWIHTIGIN